MTRTVSTEPVLSVILPCAGTASRFGAPYPKELHLLDSGASVIDVALAPILAFAAASDSRVRVVVVIGPHKSATVEHLHRHTEALDLVFVYQARRHGGELAGAVRAALPLCQGPTALVLPDQLIRDTAHNERFAEAIDQLTTHRCVALACLLADHKRLAAEGALRVRASGAGHLIDAAAEKPVDPASFNAAWATVLARAEARHVLSELVTPAGADALVGGAAVLVEDFVNVNLPTDL